MVRSPENQNASTEIDEIIADADAAFAVLLRQVKELTRIESLLSGHCAPDLIPHFQVAVMRNDHLILQTPSATWATRLRMQTSTILPFLQASGYPQLRQIDIQVAPLYRVPTSEKVRKPLSPEAKIALSHIAALTGASFTDHQRPEKDEGVEA